MYFNKSIEISKNIPSDIAKDLARMEEIYDGRSSDDYETAEFDILAESIDVDIRHCMSYGIISEEEGIKILRKIGFR